MTLEVTPDHLIGGSQSWKSPLFQTQIKQAWTPLDLLAGDSKWLPCPISTLSLACLSKFETPWLAIILLVHSTIEAKSGRTASVTGALTGRQLSLCMYALAFGPRLFKRTCGRVTELLFIIFTFYKSAVGSLCKSKRLKLQVIKTPLTIMFPWVRISTVCVGL